MRHTACLFLAAVSLLAATRPHYGGTLRIRTRSTSLDARSPNNLAPLVFDRLVTFSESGRPQPALAKSWRHDADFKRWEFQLRPGVKFHDGTALTAEVVAAQLEPMGAMAQNDTIIIRPKQGGSKLLSVLAAEPIFKRGADGTQIGAGPFRIAAREDRRVVLAANDEYWGGRPYLDTIEVELGRSLREQVLDLELNKADIVELGFSDMRRAGQDGKRAWSSPPVDLLALAFETPDERVREAITLSIDRAAINDVLLQKHGVPTGAIRPQWLSGYAFLFPTTRDLNRARELARLAAPVTIAYDPADPLTRLIVERIAVNAREVGLVVRPVAEGTQPASARLTRTRVVSPGLDAPESSYAEESAQIRERRMIPLFHLPEIYGLGPRVRGWAPSRWGGWNLESVWLAP